VLGGEPGHRLFVAVDVFRHRPGLGRVQVERAASTVNQHGGGVGGVQVMVEHAGSGGPAVGRSVGGAGLLGGVGAQQVVEDEPAGGGLGEQVAAGQLAQQAAGGGQVKTGQAGRGRRGDLRPGMQAKQPEQPGGRGVQALVGPRKHGAHVGGVLAGGQRVQPAAGVAQLGGQRGQGEAGVGHRAGGGDGQSQRQPGAGRDQLAGGGRLGRDPAGPQPLGQQLARLGHAKHVQADLRRSVGHHQAGQLVAAGDQHPRGRRARQQRPDLDRVPGVVQYDQHPLARQQAAIQRLAAVQGSRDPGRRDLQRVQERPQRLGGRQRAGGPEAAQVHVQLPIGEPGCGLPGPVHRQRGLAHPRRPSDGGDQHRPARRYRRQRPQLARPAGEIRHRGRQQAGAHGGPVGVFRAGLPRHRGHGQRGRGERGERGERGGRG
jgi:hypothetical protein